MDTNHQGEIIARRSLTWDRTLGLFSNIKGDLSGAVSASILTLLMSLGYGLIAFAPLGADRAQSTSSAGCGLGGGRLDRQSGFSGICGQSTSNYRWFGLFLCVHWGSISTLTRVTPSWQSDQSF
jgi:hypothetical protein